MDYSKKLSLLSRIKWMVENRGLYYFIKKFFYVYIFKFYALLWLRKRDMTFKNKKVRYLFHSYNHTWANERAIEVPLVLSFIEKVNKKDILEVGNALSHYMTTGWDVIDKYEKADNVVNVDVVDYIPSKKYPVIICISSLEHIGYDEHIRDNKKILKAIDNLKKNCLEENGKMIITLPIGWNSNVDILLSEGKLIFSEEYYFKRICWDNKWTISNKSEVLQTKFAKPYIGANGLVLGVMKQ